MTFEERIDKLTERHEALSETVEILTRDIDSLKQIAVTSLDSIKRLERIALSHEVRMQDVESRLDDLERK